MFLVVDFVKEKVMEIIAEKWLIDENNCYWPPCKSFEVGSYARRQVDPDQSWSVYEMEIVRRADTYEEARKKLWKATSKSDREKLTSDPENYGRGKRDRRKRRLSQSSSSSSDEPPSRKMTSLLDRLPKAPTAKDFASTSSPISHFIDPIPESYTPQSQKICSKSQPVTFGLTAHSVQEANPQQDMQISQNKNEENNVLRLILKNQKFITSELERLRRSIDYLIDKKLDKASTSNATAFEPDFGTLPLNDEEALSRLEKLLSVEDNGKLFVKKLRRFGGSMFQDHTRRIMRHIFTDALAEKYNWTGHKDKKTFSSLILCRLIIDAVCEENVTSRANVEEVIKTWLRHAKERKNYIKKKDL